MCHAKLQVDRRFCVVSLGDLWWSKIHVLWFQQFVPVKLWQLIVIRMLQVMRTVVFHISGFCWFWCPCLVQFATSKFNTRICRMRSMMMVTLTRIGMRRKHLRPWKAASFVAWNLRVVLTLRGPSSSCSCSLAGRGGANLANSHLSMVEDDSSFLSIYAVTFCRNF